MARKFSIKKGVSIPVFSIYTEDGKELSSLQVLEILNGQQSIIDGLEKSFDDIVEWASEIAKRNVLLDERIGQLQIENEQLKIANARWLDKSVQDKQTQYSNTNYQELTTKYLQLKEENEQLRKELNIDKV